MSHHLKIKYGRRFGSFPVKTSRGFLPVNVRFGDAVNYSSSSAYNVVKSYIFLGATFLWLNMTTFRLASLTPCSTLFCHRKLGYIVVCVLYITLCRPKLSSLACNVFLYSSSFGSKVTSLLINYISAQEVSSSWMGVVTGRYEIIPESSKRNSIPFMGQTV